ncbi:MAG: recombinase family protein [Chthoniobacteraceae bacterium]
MENGQPVGIWIRVSTEDQARGESPEHHERRARHYAEMKGWTVKEIYHLEGVSGKLVSKHAETQRMLADIRRGHISALIFSKLARLARNTRELLDFADIFRQSGADLVSLQESIDTSTPAGRLFYTMIAAMAQWEREEITERVNASVPIRAKLGKPLGGAAPFGYQWVDKKLVVHPDEGPIRRLIYELFLEHRRKKTVASHLNRSGYRTRKGSKFGPSTIGSLIQDSTAKGVHRTNYSRRTADDLSWEYKPESEWVLTETESLVSEELWNQCNQILGTADKPLRSPSKRAVHLFAGFVVCQCGSKMYVPSNSPKYVCAACKMKVASVDLEAIFFDQLSGFLVSPTQIESYLGQAAGALKEKQGLLESRKKEADRVRNEVEKTYRLYLENEITSDAFGRFFKPLEERQKQLEEEIPRIQADMDFLKVNQFSSDQILNDSHGIQSRWPELDSSEKRKIVECITKKIEIGKDEIAIDLCYLPSSVEMSKRDWSLGDSNP